MKRFSYYETPMVSRPDEEYYITKFYYKKGKLILTKKGCCFEEDFTAPEGCIEEQSLDEISYQYHLDLYRQEILRLQKEFKKDLLEKYWMTGHPIAEEYFSIAWEFGSGQFKDVEYYFERLIGLSITKSKEDDLSFTFKVA